MPSEIRGMLTLEQLRQKIGMGEIETVVTVFSDRYGRLIGKRVTGDFFLEQIAESGMHACDYLLTVDMAMEPIPGYKFANWELGYGDFHCVPDLHTLRVASWLDKSAMVMCDIYNEKTHQQVSVAPRSLLNQQVDAAAKMGYLALASSELEYFIFKETYESAHDK